MVQQPVQQAANFKNTTKHQPVSFKEPAQRITRTQNQQPRPRNQNQAERSPGGSNEVISGQPETAPPEALTVKRPPPKTKKDRKGDCSSKGPPKYTAEQLRLNPMLAFEGEEEKKGPPKKALTAEQRRLNPMAGGAQAAGSKSKG